MEEVKKRLQRFRDLIAYRIVISMPRCHLESEEEREAQELKCIYEIANVLPGFLEKRGFTVIPTGGIKRSTSPLMKEEVKDCFRDYICLLYTSTDRCHRKYRSDRSTDGKYFKRDYL